MIGELCGCWLLVRRIRSDRVMPTCVIVESSAWTMLCLNAEKKDGLLVIGCPQVGYLEGIVWVGLGSGDLVG